jgi:hypothetical protein
VIAAQRCSLSSERSGGPVEGWPVLKFRAGYVINGAAPWVSHSPWRQPWASYAVGILPGHSLDAYPARRLLHDALTTAQLFLALATRLERHGRGTLGALRRVAGRT